MIQKVILHGIKRPMPSPFTRGQYVLTAECGHLHAANRELPFDNPFEWPDSPKTVDCKSCDDPEFMAKWQKLFLNQKL